MKTIGFNGDSQKIQQIWNKNALAWKNLVSPWRPSKADIAMYKHLSRDHISGTVLILGATPELRDLIAEESEEPYVVADISGEMLSATSRLLRFASPEKEVWIQSDWTDLPHLLKTKFDLIVGDMVWWVLSLESQQKVKETIYTLLKPDGVFVSRFRLQNEAVKTIEPNDIVTSYLKRRDKADNDVVVRNELLSDLYDKLTDQYTKRLSCDKVKTILRNYTYADLSDDDRSFLMNASGRTIGADWTVQTYDEIMRVIKTHFELSGEGTADDYRATYYPILQLSRRPSAAI